MLLASKLPQDRLFGSSTNDNQQDLHTSNLHRPLGQHQTQNTAVDKHYPDLIAQPALSSAIRPSLAAERQRYRQAGGTYGWE